MNVRRTLVLLATTAAAMTMGSQALAAPAGPAEPDRGERRTVDLDLSAAGEARAAAADGSLFTPTSPVRVLDTRSGIGLPSPGAVPPRGTVTLDLSTRVPAGTWAVVLNLTGVAPTSSSFVTVWPSEEAQPTVSNLNLAANEIRANAVTVALGPSRTLNLYNHNGTINLVADLAGYYAPEGQALYNAHGPARVLDTRNGRGPIPAGGSIVVDTSTLVPSTGVKALTLNLTVVNPTATTFLTAYPTNVARPNASSINATRGRVTANQVTVAVGADKDIRLYNNSGSAHVIVDVVGNYDTGFGDAFYPVNPTRLVDTRADGGGPLQGGFYYPWAIAEDPESPDATISAMVMNVTGTGGTAATYLTLFPSGSPVPSASTINLSIGQSASNLATTSLGWDSDDIGPYYGFNVYNHAGRIHVILDWAGFFAPPVL
ncbi:hypothetical protein [Actinophytocola sediminis]